MSLLQAQDDPELATQEFLQEEQQVQQSAALPAIPAEELKQQRAPVLERQAMRVKLPEVATAVRAVLHERLRSNEELMRTYDRIAKAAESTSGRWPSAPSPPQAPPTLAR